MVLIFTVDTTRNREKEHTHTRQFGLVYLRYYYCCTGMLFFTSAGTLLLDP